MSKRKNPSDISSGGELEEKPPQRGSKLVRMTDAVDVASTSEMQPIVRRAAVTFALIAAMESDGSVLERVQVVCQLMKEAMEPEFKLLDMSMREDEDNPKSKPALFMLFHLLEECLEHRRDTEELSEMRNRAYNRLSDEIQTFLVELLLTFDPTVTDAETGNNALHELLSLMRPLGPVSLASRLVYQLAKRGVDVNGHNFEGRTPLLIGAGTSWQSGAPSGHFVRLLKQLGADINAQDNHGDSLVHHLIREKAFKVLWDLLKVGGVDELNLALENNQGQSATDIAIVHAEKPTKAMDQMHQRVCRQVRLWYKRVRPEILQQLSQPMIPDLAQLVMEYLDGSGKPFMSATETEGEEEEDMENE